MSENVDAIPKLKYSSSRYSVIVCSQEGEEQGGLVQNDKSWSVHNTILSHKNAGFN